MRKALRLPLLVSSVVVFVLTALPGPEVLAVTLNPGDILIVDANTGSGSVAAFGAVIRVDRATGAQTVVSLGGSFRDPMGIAIDASGQILVVDERLIAGSPRVTRVDPFTGTQTTVSAGGNLVHPVGIAIQADGQILVADRDAGASGAVIRVNPATGAQTIVSTGGNFSSPGGIAIAANGDILVADADAFPDGAVIRVDPATGAQTIVSSGGSFRDPSGIAIAANGDILVADPNAFGGNGGVIRVDPATGAQTTVSSGGSFGDPHGIAIAANGDILVADAGAFFGGNGGVIRVDPATGAQTIVSSGGSFTDPVGIAIVPSTIPGLVLAWGRNGRGQLGDGTTTDRPSPVQVSGLTDALAIAAGADHSLALVRDGTIRAWGLNEQGQLGDGTTTDSAVPVQVSGLTNVVAVAAGRDHSLALKRDGTVWAWGSNGAGQLGDGAGPCSCSSLVPVRATGLTDVIAIRAGLAHSLALKRDGTVWAWGFNDDGQLGNGSSSISSIPVQVRGNGGIGFLTDVVAISAGGFHSLAVKSDFTVWAWGLNSSGQLGDGTTASTATPVQVSGVTAIDVAGGGMACGPAHSLALEVGRTVRAWGRSREGQLGDGTSGGLFKLLAVQTKDPGDPTGNLTQVASIAAGCAHSLAVRHDGTVRAWGANSEGQLGDGTFGMGNFRSTPVPVSGVNRVIGVAGGFTHSLALAVGNTPVGSSVVVQPLDTTTAADPVTIMFSSVTQLGLTTLTTSNNGPTAPSGFRLGNPPTYYQLTTTAVFTPPITVCIDYSGIAFTGPPQLWHFENGVWVNVTTSVNTVTQIICGVVSSLSPFALFETVPGRMHGDGRIDQGGQRHHFEFRVVERADGKERGSLHYRAREHRPGRDRDDDDNDDDTDRDGRRRRNRFVATAITSVSFSDDPGITPGRTPKVAVDTVVFSGTGRWNGAKGYSFEARAADAGEPGRGGDTFALTIRAPGGAVVATVSGPLAGGNIQSSRVRR